MYLWRYIDWYTNKECIYVCKITTPKMRKWFSLASPQLAFMFHIYFLFWFRLVLSFSKPKHMHVCCVHTCPQTSRLGYFGLEIKMNASPFVGQTRGKSAEPFFNGCQWNHTHRGSNRYINWALRPARSADTRVQFDAVKFEHFCWIYTENAGEFLQFRVFLCKNPSRNDTKSFGEFRST